MGECDVKWYTYEEVPDLTQAEGRLVREAAPESPQPKRDTIAVDPKVVESLKQAGDPKNNPTGPGGNAQKHPEPAKA